MEVSKYSNDATREQDSLRHNKPLDLSLPKAAPNSSTPMDQKLESWLEQELAKTVQNRGGENRRVVCLATQNEESLKIARKLFGQHGVEVLLVPDEINTSKIGWQTQFFNIKREDITVIAAITESPETSTLSAYQPHHDDPVLFNEMNPSPAQPGPITEREMNLSLCVRELLQYSNSQKSQWSLPSNTRAVELSLDPAKILKQTTTFARAMHKSQTFSNIVGTALNGGMFFVSPENRRQKHVYYAGLNSGVPLLTKSRMEDMPHLILHDIVHELMPDPIVSNQLETPLERQMYFAHRSIAEVIAVSLDMWFVDLFEQEDLSRERCAATLMKHCMLSRGRDFDSSVNLKKLISANIDLLLKGDPESFQQICDGSLESHTALANYQRKMTRLLIGDLYWAAENLNSKISLGSGDQTWTEDVIDTLGSYDLFRETLPQAVARLELSDSSKWVDTLDSVFEDIYANQIEPILVADKITIETTEHRRTKSLVRWIAGQMSLFSKFDQLTETKETHKKITAVLNQSDSTRENNNISHHDQERIRQAYDSYLESLRRKHYINFDDEATFRELMPIFSPHYMTFSQYDDLHPVIEAERLVLAGKKSLSSQSTSQEIIAGIRRRRSTEKYEGFEAIQEHFLEGLDFEISARVGTKNFLCAAWHGGFLEQGSDILAELISGDTYNFYAFKALYPVGGVDHPLHITSTRFDEPRLLTMAQNSESVLSIHCCTTTKKPIIFIGGGAPHSEKELLVKHLRSSNFVTQLDEVFLGVHPKNPCNRGRTPGLQLEISRSLMDSLLIDKPKLKFLADVMREFLDKRYLST